MDINWEFQRENASLRKEIAMLRKEVARYRVKEVSYGFASFGEVFTEGQREFMNENELDYQKVYRLARKYNSAEDALVDALEEQYGL